VPLSNYTDFDELGPLEHKVSTRKKAQDRHFCPRPRIALSCPCPSALTKEGAA